MKKLTLLFLLCSLAIQVYAQQKTDDVNAPSQNAQELADKLSNPVASMISVPFQNNTDWGIGEHNGSKNTLNFQPVIPIKLSSNLNLITRYIIPIVSQHDVTGENTQQFGLSDTTVSAWVSPSHPKNGFIWGAGPALLIPTATFVSVFLLNHASHLLLQIHDYAIRLYVISTTYLHNILYCSACTSNSSSVFMRLHRQQLNQSSLHQLHVIFQSLTEYLPVYVVAGSYPTYPHSKNNQQQVVYIIF
jgi:hypothetical protein